jgi:hypothetical protein
MWQKKMRKLQLLIIQKVSGEMAANLGGTVEANPSQCQNYTKVVQC